MYSAPQNSTLFPYTTLFRSRQYGEGYALALGRLIARNRRRYGGYIVHTGIVILFVAFAGMAFKTETEASLRPDRKSTRLNSSQQIISYAVFCFKKKCAWMLV